MFITVRFGDNREEIFNPHSKICVLLDNIKERCDCQKEDIVDLSDEIGNRKNLYLNPMDYAIKHVNEREILILVKIERFPGSLNDSCVPLLDGLQGDKNFLRNLNTKLNEQPTNSQEEGAEKQRNFQSRRGSVNLRKQKSNFAVNGGKRSNRTTRSQSIAAPGGTASYSKLSKKLGK